MTKVETMQGPKRATTVLLAFILLTTGFADYWEYSKAYHANPAIYADILHGTGTAPNQYRIGVIAAADFMARHAHVGLRHAFALIDMVAGFAAVFTLFSLLRRSAVYRGASQQGRWFSALAYLILVQFYLAWVTWYQRPETLTTAALVALTLLLLTVRVPLPGVAGYAATAGGMLLIAVAQGFVRADVAFGLHAGVLLFCFTRASAGLSLPRTMQAGTSLLAVFAAAGIQYYMMHIRYPHASYGDTPVFQLVLNFKESARLIAFTLFIVPYAWTVKTVLRRQVAAEAPALGLLYGSAVFMAMWWMAGRVEEVRIFLPFALALAPLTAQCAVERWVLEERAQEA
jgi:hypothetical protein